MRPLRLLLTLASSVVLVTILLKTLSHRQDRINGAHKVPGRFSTLFSFHTPLFPPSAIISLTDDNSTFFLARPAAFGPLLPQRGLSGQLWIGSGFSDDTLGRGGFTVGAEGELGCSDVPGWDETTGSAMHSSTRTASRRSQLGKDSAAGAREGKEVNEGINSSGEDHEDDYNLPSSEDGTDDHLHTSLYVTSKVKQSKGSQHADIESIQQSAEIAGKVVLLSRGGCGFLEKVKWAQRRGGIAVIVGDDVPGGPLVTMYANGDTSNVTIPALFTSHTTAHLLSSLVHPGDSTRSPPGAVRPAKSDKGGKSRSSTKGQKSNKKGSKSVSTSTESSAKHISGQVQQKTKQSNTGFFEFLLSIFRFGSNSRSNVSRRPPSSGRNGWVQVEDCPDCGLNKGSKKVWKGSMSLDSLPKDGFVIGVQDWRDPDLLNSDDAADADTKAVQPRAATMPKAEDSKNEEQPKPNSIVPGSGEYEDVAAMSDESKRLHASTKNKLEEKGNSWFSRLFHHGSSKSGETDANLVDEELPEASAHHGLPSTNSDAQQGTNPLNQHEGLWVTLTPTNMSSSPFFDTLLVLVVSPLITLTVVYALLLIRSRIRRRRWRAPKSVVDRLPVRTYHTLSSEASTSALATPVSASPTTPLLQSNPRQVIPRSISHNRPRSFTTSEVPQPSSSAPHAARADHSSSESEKIESGLAAWRRRYGGRQKECVVCLEEYVDGVSRVMSLPCGHEFHADCITPWLTTRRRTCPICKGDVVRSMARQQGRLSRQSSYSSNHESQLASDGDGEDDVEASTAPNRSRPRADPAATTSDNHDLERGQRANNRSSASPMRLGWSFLNGWNLAALGSSSSSSGGSSSGGGRRRTPPPADVDRDR